ncbi:helix-turn-helix domain-containing protein [Sphingomonas sp. CL5.1]|uniref:citrate synthase n=1 Tax=Sphingomonas sp. CL5.1 TaxID=2653203 RepID=UPI00158360AB|nr:citrate synthase [Sphingomonas sp. CL5.1]QKR99840.1 helix-turn-helix domain-containing protein [Sphingomonas sp. CL5.1]
MDDAEWVSASEAATMLGVSLSTLYVYVGRKGLRSRPVGGSRARRYLKADLLREMSRKNGPRMSSAGPTTAITHIDATGPSYRGHNAIALAEHATLEQTAALLWEVDEAEVFTDDVPRSTDEFERLANAMMGQNGIDRATALLHLLEGANPRSFDLSPQGMARTGADAMRWLAAILLGQSAPAKTPIHETVGAALKLDEAQLDLTRRLLVLTADHGLELAARAVRALASTGVTPWRTVTAGLLVAAGRRSWFGYAYSVRRLLAEITESADPREPVMRRLRHGDDVPGFGSRQYDGEDPRARALLASCFALLPADRELEKVMSAIELMREWSGLQPDFPFARALVSLKLGVDDSDILFPLARSAGWVAHSIEQFQSDMRTRPTHHRELIRRVPTPTD